MKHGKKITLSLLIVAGLILMAGGNLWALSTASIVMQNGPLDPNQPEKFLQATLTVTAYDLLDSLPSGAPARGVGEYAYTYQLENTGNAPLHIFSLGLIAYNNYGFISGTGTIDPEPIDVGGDDITFNFLSPTSENPEYNGEIKTGQFTSLLFVYSYVAPNDPTNIGAIATLQNGSTAADAIVTGPSLYGVNEAPVTNVPEPATLLLLGLGFFGAGIFRKKFCKP